MVTLLTFILALAITIRIACWAAHADRTKWAERQFVYFGMALGLSMIVGGAWAIVVRCQYADIILLVGVSLLILSNRRSPFRGGK
jgi:hypothetical protein